MSTTIEVKPQGFDRLRLKADKLTNKSLVECLDLVGSYVESQTRRRIQKEKQAPDVIDNGFSVDYLKKVLTGSKRAVKLVILDQDKVGGAGNIYANDALYLAKIRPDRPANSRARSLQTPMPCLSKKPHNYCCHRFDP